MRLTCEILVSSGNFPSLTRLSFTPVPIIDVGHWQIVNPRVLTRNPGGGFHKNGAVALNHLFFKRSFHDKPTILGIFPIYGNPHVLKKKVFGRQWRIAKREMTLMIDLLYHLYCWPTPPLYLHIVQIISNPKLRRKTHQFSKQWTLPMEIPVNPHVFLLVHSIWQIHGHDLHMCTTIARVKSTFVMIKSVSH